MNFDLCDDSTPLMYAVHGSKNNIESVKQILETCTKDEINAQNDGGDTALHIAVWYSTPECVKLLLENKANPNIENYDKVSILVAAIVGEIPSIHQFNLEIIKLLIDYGANVNGHRVMNNAAWKCDQGNNNIYDYSCIELLLERGATYTHISNKERLLLIKQAEINILKRHVQELKNFREFFSHAIKNDHTIIGKVPIDVLGVIGEYI